MACVGVLVLCGSPPWRRPRRRPQATGAFPVCRCFVRLRRQTGGEWVQGRGRRRSCEAAAAGWCGGLVADLSISGGGGAAQARIRGRSGSGRGPGRCSSSAFRSSSQELVDVAALRRHGARSSSAPRWRTPAGVRRGWVGLLQRRCSLVFSCCFRCLYVGLVLVFSILKTSMKNTKKKKSKG